MTDIHSHILFNVDDGSKSIEESIELLKKLHKIGFNNVILTPHYIKDSEYSSKNKEKKQKLNELKEELINQNININIYLGNEIFINNEIYDLIKEGEIHTLNNTRYILVELPFHNEIVNLETLQQEYNAMINSVKKYKGFYIGRYETSLSDATSTSAGISETMQSKAGVIPTSNAISSTNQWYGLYERQKMYNTEYVQGSMIWGSQYDAMLNWVINSDSADKHKISEDTNGNHSGSLVTTGKYSNDKINNIYDLEGNLFEWTLEAMGEVDRTIRGGSFLVGMPSNRSTAVATYNSPEYFGSRLTLYIK